MPTGIPYIGQATDPVRNADSHHTKKLHANSAPTPKRGRKTRRVHAATTILPPTSTTVFYMRAISASNASTFALCSSSVSSPSSSSSLFSSSPFDLSEFASSVFFFCSDSDANDRTQDACNCICCVNSNGFTTRKDELLCNAPKRFADLYCANLLPDSARSIEGP